MKIPTDIPENKVSIAIIM